MAVRRKIALRKYNKEIRKNGSVLVYPTKGANTTATAKQEVPLHQGKRSGALQPTPTSSIYAVPPRSPAPKHAQTQQQTL